MLPIPKRTPSLPKPYSAILLIGILLGNLLIPGWGEELTIIHTNDTHSHLLPFDAAGFGKNLGGLARRYGFIKSIQASETHTLIVDGGDFFQGTPFFSFFKGELEAKAYALCGYDAWTLGNHDLDEGLANLLDKVRLAGVPLVCTNVTASDGRDIFTPFQVVTRGSLRIGILGCLGRGAWNVIAGKCQQGLMFLEPVTALRKRIQELRPQVDLLILLSHSGYEEDLKLARELPGLDVIVGGHTNTYLESPTEVHRVPTLIPGSPSTGCGTLVVQAYKWGLFTGVLRLHLDEGKKVASYAGSLVLMNDTIPVRPDSPATRLVEAYEARIRHVTGTVVGKCPGGMTYPEEEKHLKSLPLGSYICEAMREFAEADLALINSGGIRSDFPAGDITVGDLFKAVPFDNTIVTYRLKGRDLLAMLEFIGTNYGTITGYQYAGVTFRLHQRSKKISHVQIGGKPLDPDHTYVLATISYLADGAQHGETLFRKGFDQQDNGFYLRDILIEHIRKSGEVRPPPGDRLILCED